MGINPDSQREGQAPQFVSILDKDKITIYKLLRDYIKHEDDLIKDRLTWILTIHGFLYATYGLTLQTKMQNLSSSPDKGKYPFSETALFWPILQVNVFTILIALVGLAISYYGMRSIGAARRASETIFRISLQYPKPYTRRVPKDQEAYTVLVSNESNNVPILLPIIAGGGNIKNVDSGFSASRGIPVILVCSWLCAILFSMFEVYEDYSLTIFYSISGLLLTIGIIWVLLEYYFRKLAANDSHEHFGAIHTQPQSGET